MKLAKWFLVIWLVGFFCLSIGADFSSNCHSQAWEGGGSWVTDLAPFKANATQIEEPIPGCIIVHTKGGTATHSGVYLGDGWCEGKLGHLRVVHHPTWLLFPVYGSNVSYWVQN